MFHLPPYALSLTHYRRIPSIEVKVGDLGIGGDNPIRIQSMTTADTMDTLKTVDESIRMIEAGCELVRITAPSKLEAENLRNIRDELRRRGYHTPLVADIHFTPNAAEIAARIVEKVRVNPGNYADKKKFEFKDYTDSTYQAELERIYKKFAPLVKVCKEYGTAMRIGTNHGSLSDRIMSRYGDTPQGMVESAMEFIRICEDLNYNQLVISMKSSNPLVMMQAYRLLAAEMLANGRFYPLHLGVTEAGEGEDGRIKSGMGIGALLADGLGDTVRVSLTEAPEYEMPVARALVKHYLTRYITSETPASEELQLAFNPYAYKRRTTRQVANFGGDQTARVMADFSFKSEIDEMDMAAIGHSYWPEVDKWTMSDQGADYVYLADNPAPFMLPNGLKAVYDAKTWLAVGDEVHSFPFFQDLNAFLTAEKISPTLNFVGLTGKNYDASAFQGTRTENVVLVSQATERYAIVARQIVNQLILDDIQCPVIARLTVAPDPDDHTQTIEARYQLAAAADLGEGLLDGLFDGLLLSAPASLSGALSSHDLGKLANRTAFGLLQAARLRITKTEYISCPSCGRTLFDLQETTAKIRSQTEHLKGVKIGIMGCIVNGPGEMADADYGYVGAGPGTISLYRGQNMIEKAVPTEKAVGKLIELIAADGRWFERAETD